MAFRCFAATISAVAILAVGCADEPKLTPVGDSSPEAVVPATFIDGCGVVAYPATGARGTVTVITGAVPCQEAMRITDRYLHDSSLVHTGNTWSAEFEGWMCATPTSAAAEEYGYLSSCRDEHGSEIRVTPERPPGAEPLALDCDEADIAANMGQQLNVQRCYGNWAYVSSGELGDAQSLIRLVNSRWERYTGFPSSICKAQAVTDGVPVPELRSFMC